MLFLDSPFRDCLFLFERGIENVTEFGNVRAARERLKPVIKSDGNLCFRVRGIN